MQNKALLVGINAYANPNNNLRGCINDIIDMEHYISIENSIYQKENIKTLIDHQATKKGILKALNWLLLGASAGDQLLFHYSGHGAQIPNKGINPEKDGMDEIICPYDFEDNPETAIGDKQFAQIFSTIPKGVHFVWISDSCHAEDLSRKILETEKPSNELLSNQTLYRRFNPNFSHTIPMVNSIKHKLPSESINVISSTLNGALLSGCASHQLSADAFINNRFNGAFTHYLIKNLIWYGDTKSMQQIVKYANIDLKENGYDQNPQSEGVLVSHCFFNKNN